MPVPMLAMVRARARHALCGPHLTPCAEAETEARIVAALKSEQWQHTLTETLPVLARATHQPLAGGRPIAPEEVRLRPRPPRRACQPLAR